MNNDKTILYRIEKDIAVITFNRPEVRNSLNFTMRSELLAAIQQADNDDSVRVAVITAAGKSFCSGADLTEQSSSSGDDGFVTALLREQYNPIIQAITHAEKPFISLVNGAAAGIGAALAMACDLMVMADDAFLYSAFAAISLIPDGGSHKLLQSYLGTNQYYPP